MKHTDFPSGYPYPDRKTPIYEHNNDDYEHARMVWRKSLSDTDVRSLAVDYRMGKQTEENYDASQEYYARGLHIKRSESAKAYHSRARKTRKNRG